MTDYDLYFVVEDAVPQFSDIISSTFSTITLPNAEITADGDLTFCIGGDVNLTATTGNGISYLLSLIHI